MNKGITAEDFVDASVNVIEKLKEENAKLKSEMHTIKCTSDVIEKLKDSFMVGIIDKNKEIDKLKSERDEESGGAILYADKYFELATKYAELVDEIIHYREKLGRIRDWNVSKHGPSTGMPEMAGKAMEYKERE